MYRVVYLDRARSVKTIHQDTWHEAVEWARTLDTAGFQVLHLDAPSEPYTGEDPSQVPSP